jgi:hypothetical protein
MPTEKKSSLFAKARSKPRNRRTPEQRRADRAAGVDRYGNPLPRCTPGTPAYERRMERLARKEALQAEREYTPTFRNH